MSVENDAFLAWIRTGKILPGAREVSAPSATAEVHHLVGLAGSFTVEAAPQVRWILTHRRWLEADARAVWRVVEAPSDRLFRQWIGYRAARAQAATLAHELTWVTPAALARERADAAAAAWTQHSDKAEIVYLGVSKSRAYSIALERYAADADLRQGVKIEMHFGRERVVLPSELQP